MCTANDGDHRVEIMSVPAAYVGGGWCTPGCGGDDHTCLASTPPYQPMRNAVAFQYGAVVDTYRVTSSPCSALTRPAYPSIWPAVLGCCTVQPGVPGRAFSVATHVAGRAVVVGWAARA